MAYNLSFGYVWGFRDALLYGLANTLLYVCASIVLGLILGFLVANARQYGGRVLGGIAATYVEIFRGTPVLVQLFWFFFCLPALTGIDFGAATCSILCLTLYMGSVASESFRASLKVIGAEQRDACIALGLPSRVVLPYVILPQACMRSIPTLLSNVVTLFKESALISAMGVTDLMYQSQSIAEETGRPIEILTVAALIYFVIAFSLTRVVSYFEKRMLLRMA